MCAALTLNGDEDPFARAADREYGVPSSSATGNRKDGTKASSRELAFFVFTAEDAYAREN
ncbi:hypothetical protein WN982_14180 [Paraburkholderia sp. IMGN_8]|uniref:hypothetical protein n=1 Tax=Paraburkholderia sp. IMGN_8 TaxID=3136564 RepID=UPI0031011A0B